MSEVTCRICGESLPADFIMEHLRLFHPAENDAPACPQGCADVVTGEPYRIRPSNPDHPDDGWYCPSCWESVTPPGKGEDDDGEGH